MGSGLSPLDTFAAKQERERQQQIASRKEALRSRAEEQRFAQEQAMSLQKVDKYQNVFDKEPHRAGRVFKAGNSPLKKTSIS